MTLRAKLNKGGLSCELILDGIPRARMRLDADGGPDEKREIVAAVVDAVNVVADIECECPICGLDHDPGECRGAA